MLKSDLKFLLLDGFLLFALLFPFLGFAQAPGGVEGSAMWISVEEQNQNYFLKEKKSIVTLCAIDKMELLNSNPTILFDGNTLVPAIDFPKHRIDQLHVFSVYAPRDSILEKGVWYIRSLEKDELLLTTHRLADFSTGKFMNNLKDQKQQPQLNTYQRFINSKRNGNYQIVIGDNQLKQNIPVTPFFGKFAELIVFDRILNNLDKAKVESYLALKYGISLDKNLNQSLYNSANQIIWDTKNLSEFSNNIAGVGRDDASGLFQKQSSAVYSDNIFSVGLNQFAKDNSSNPSALNDLQFLIWGSNSKALTQEAKQPGLIQKLNRRWRIQNHGNIDQPTQLMFDMNKVDADESPEEIFWLIVDQSGSGKFDISATEYFQMSKIDESGMVVFDEVNWDNIEAAHFSIGLGPEMIPVMQVDAPDCSRESNGSLLLTAKGGKAPYLFEVINEAGMQIFSSFRNDSTPFEVKNISAGTYQLLIRDNDGSSYQEEFFINPKEAPISTLEDHYAYNDQKELILDASIGMETSIEYEWISPSGNIFSEAAISIKEVGTYLLKMTNEECLSQKRIQISSAFPNNFKSVDLFPNPVSDGIFQLEVQLEQPAELEIQVVNVTGSILHSIQLDDQINHQYQGYIPEPGMYLIKLISAGSVETQKLIVHQKS